MNARRVLGWCLAGSLIVAAIGAGACVGDDAGSSSGASGGSSGSSGASGGPGVTHQPGEKCNPGDTCVGGVCVDGFCCNSPCTDTCSACDVAGHEGTCTPVTGAPHGTTRACLGDKSGACAGSCDGATTAACVYPSAACGDPPSCTAGVGTTAGKCDQGTCKQAKQNCPDKLCGANECLSVTQVGTGYDFTCALMSDKTVRCWGHNLKGQLGQGGTDTNDRLVPTPVPGLTDVTAIAVGDSHACAIVTGGVVKCWGINASHQLGLGEALASNDSVAHTTPSPVCLTGTGATCVPLQNAKVIGAGPDNTCAVSGTNTYCWGDNSQGQLGCGACTGVTTANPVVVCGPNACPPTNHLGDTGGAITKFAMGFDFVCALNGSNQVFCWGSNNSGAIGQDPNTVNTKTQPVQVLGIDVGLQKSIDIAASSYTGCAIISDGTTANNLVRCWGYGSNGERGNSTSGPSAYGNAPVTVCSAAGCAANYKGATSIAGGGGGPSGAEAFCATSGGAVSCWGDNRTGEIGVGSTTTNLYTVATASGVTTGALEVASGTEGHFCARLNAGGTLRCWGKNQYGQIGANATMPNPQPTPTAQSW